MTRALAVLSFSIVLAACATTPSPGATCARSSDCASPLSCHFGRCRVACSADRDCSAGASCLLDADGVGTCTLDTDLGCESGVGRECASGLVCVADRCAQICSATIGCATGSICTPSGSGVSFCAPSGFDASIASDAGADASVTSAAVGTACIGEGFVCATLGPTHQPYCWGSDATHSLGYEPGDTSAGCMGIHGDSDHALAVPITDVDQLACGREWVCAHRSTDGAVLCWGDTNSGQIDPASPSVCDRTPHAVTGARFDVGQGQLATSTELVCVLAAGAMTCWGGDQGTVMPRDPPIVDPIIQRLAGFTAIGTSLIGASAHPTLLALSDGLANPNEAFGGACYVDANDGGRVWCWGTSSLGQCGGTLGNVVQPATSVLGGPMGVSALIHGAASVCALDTMHELWCWGDDEHGDLAHTNTGFSGCPVDATSYACTGVPQHYPNATFSAIAGEAGGVAFCGIAASGTGFTAGGVYCWGSGEFSTNAHSGPATVDDPRNGPILREDGTPLVNAVAVFSDWNNACAIDADGALWCWGMNGHTQLQRPSTTTDSVRAIRMQLP